MQQTNYQKTRVRNSIYQCRIKGMVYVFKFVGRETFNKRITSWRGTPTFFSSENLKNLLNCIINTSNLADGYEFSFEGHPNNTNTTKEHLQTLYDIGFRRVSFGVQDYNQKAQTVIGRIQPFKNVMNITRLAREIGYTSVGHDIIYGLPFQTLKDIEYTIEKTIDLSPDRIAFYSYANVPWL